MTTIRLNQNLPYLFDVNCTLRWLNGVEKQAYLAGGFATHNQAVIARNLSTVVDCQLAVRALNQLGLNGTRSGAYSCQSRLRKWVPHGVAEPARMDLRSV